MKRTPQEHAILRKKLIRKKQRLEIDKYRCKACDRGLSSAELTLHHKLPRGVKYRQENLVILCRECHAEWHQKFEGGIEFKKWLEIMQELHFCRNKL